MNAIVWVLATLADIIAGAQRRVRCLREGHAFLCITDGHLCKKCGRFWGYYD